MKTKPKYYFTLPIMALFLGHAGCTVPVNSTIGTQIDPAKVAQITKGVTTRQQVEQILGPCMNVVLGPDGRKTMYYTYWSTQGSAKIGVTMMPGNSQVSTRDQRLQVSLTKDGIVEDFEFADSTQDRAMKNGIVMPSGPTPGK